MTNNSKRRAGTAHRRTVKRFWITWNRCANRRLGRKRHGNVGAELRYISGRDIPREQAKEEIKALFTSKGDGLIYSDDIMEALDLRYELVADICQELERAGEIQGVKVEYDIHTKVAALLKTGDADLLRRLVDLLFERHYDPEPLSPKELAAIKKRTRRAAAGIKTISSPGKK